MIEKLLVFFVPGLDYRWLDKGRTPFIIDLKNKFPNVNVSSVPTADILPTLLTGIYPPEHSWDVSLKRQRENKIYDRLLDSLPDLLTTTFQSLLHMITGSYDLAIVPHRRRKMFEIFRTRYIKKNTDSMLRFGNYDSIFNVIGKERSVYLSNNKMKKIPKIADNITSGEFRLKIFETYSLDLIEHWNLDNEEIIDNAYRRIDDLTQEICKRCLDTDTAFMLFSDHGQVKVTGSIDLKSALGNLNLSSHDYLYYIETFRARFWFNNNYARQRITNMLNGINNASVFTYEEMNQFNLNYKDGSYGELFLVLDPGYIIFPHDFYNPFTNLYMGLKDAQQRSRIFNPLHRGNHHYRPSSESETGTLILADSRYTVSDESVIIGDLAPTILHLLGFEKPSYMKGRTAFI